MPVKKIFSVDELLIAVCIIITTAPFYIWGYEKIFLSISVIVLLAIIRIPRNIIPIRLIESSIVFLTALYTLTSSGGSYFGSIYFGFFLVFLCLLPNEKIIGIFNKLKVIFAALILPGIILWIIHHVLDKNIFYIGDVPIEKIPNEFKSAAGQGYAIYPFSVILDYMIILPFYRLQGPFDEPGWLGTMCIMLIAVDGINFKKTQDIIIIIAGLLSLSLAFYLLLFLYVAIRVNKIKLNTFLSCVSISLLFIVFFGDPLSDYVFQRLTFQDGNISGYNRDGDLTSEYINSWISSGLLGLLLGLPEYMPDGSSSYKDVLLRTGLLGVVLIFSSYAIALLSRIKLTNASIKLISFMLIFFASSLQRPDIMKPFMFFMFLSALTIAAKKIPGNIK